MMHGPWQRRKLGLPCQGEWWWEKGSEGGRDGMATLETQVSWRLPPERTHEDRKDRWSGRAPAQSRMDECQEHSYMNAFIRSYPQLVHTYLPVYMMVITNVLGASTIASIEHKRLGPGSGNKIKPYQWSSNDATLKWSYTSYAAIFVIACLLIHISCQGEILDR
jgi:hypothetical protein